MTAVHEVATEVAVTAVTVKALGAVGVGDALGLEEGLGLADGVTLGDELGLGLTEGVALGDEDGLGVGLDEVVDFKSKL